MTSNKCQGNPQDRMVVIHSIANLILAKLQRVNSKSLISSIFINRCFVGWLLEIVNDRILKLFENTGQVIENLNNMSTCPIKYVVTILLILVISIYVFIIISGSTAHRLMVIAERFYQDFDNNGVALDILKAFGRVWHMALLPKLKCFGIFGQMFELIRFFLSNHKMKVVLMSTLIDIFALILAIARALSSTKFLMASFLNTVSLLITQ